VDRVDAGPSITTARLRRLHGLGVLSGLTAGAWLGAAEAPTKLVTLGIPPVAISLVMVLGVFLARWSLPALLRGTAGVRADLERAPHLVAWALLAGGLWAVANTLTVHAIRDVGLAIAFPLWNSNGLLGIVWGALLFGELRGAGALRWLGVCGGASVLFGGALLLALASVEHAPPAAAFRGVAAALGAGLLWGTMYIPYRKAYLTGMNPLSFLAFFTLGELATMAGLAGAELGGLAAVWQTLASARGALFWLLLGGFVWVIGDLFQQYAAKYVGIGRGIPLSNTNQLWGLLWGVLVFGELADAGGVVVARVVGGSLLMAAGALAIALSSAPLREHRSWRMAAEREAERYGLDRAWVLARLEGYDPDAAETSRRNGWDWLLVAMATATFVLAGTVAEAPGLPFRLDAALWIVAASLVLLVTAALALWRTTRFG
jgi:drug/metabolite transporter (DMT)-like permease